ncbi:MAG: Tetratricopeptide repeat protein, partial [Deltaproteobacteria bacterium]|nr:Tetratricopeptide repeat protein [Deltaproteobacteria bacterium]
MSVWCDRTVTGGLLFLILFTPFAFGSVHPWAYSIMEALLFLLVVVWMAKLFLLRNQRGENIADFEIGNSKFRIAPYALPLAAFLVFALLQLLPLPPSLLRVLSPQTHQLYTQSLPGWPVQSPYSDLLKTLNSLPSGVPSNQPALLPTVEEVKQGASVPFSSTSPAPDAAPAASYFRLPIPETWLPLSVAPALTGTDLLKFIAYVSLFFLVVCYPFGHDRRLDISARNSEVGASRFFEQRFFRSILLVVLLAGLLVAVTGFIQRFTWNGRILWFFVPFDWGGASPGANPRSSGPFVNPDHFANYLTLIFPIALAGALFRTSLVSNRLAEGFRIFSGFTAIVIFTGILLSLSRSGWACALLGVGVLFWFCPWRGADSAPWLAKSRGFSVARVSLAVLGFFLVVGLTFVGPGGREQVDSRLEDTVTQNVLAGRTELWRDSWGMFQDFPLFGVGLGSWPDLFPRYRGGPWANEFYREAHNDYLELLTETGVIGFGLLAWFFFAVGRLIFRRLREAVEERLPLLAAIAGALAVMAFHELFDFNLQIPANAFLFTLLLALALRMGAASSPFASHFARFRPHVSSIPLVAVAAFVLLVVALRQEQIPYPYNFKQPGSVAEARELIIDHPARAASHLALLQLLQGHVPAATELRETQAALWLEPNNPFLRDLYASLLLRTGKAEEGFKELTQSVLDSPSFSTHYYLSARLFPWLSTREKIAVEEGLKKALDRSYPAAGDSLGEFYARSGRFADQAALYEKAALDASDPAKKIDFQLKSGAAYARAKDEAKAEKLLRQIISTKPDDPRAYQQLVTLIHGPRKDLGLAKATVEEGIKNRAPAFVLYLSLAEAAHAAGSPDGRRAALTAAKDNIKSAVQEDQDPYSLYLLLADAASKTQDREAEKAALSESL